MKRGGRFLWALFGRHSWRYHNRYDRRCSVCGRHEVSHCWTMESWANGWWEVFNDGAEQLHYESYGFGPTTAAKLFSSVMLAVLAALIWLAPTWELAALFIVLAVLTTPMHWLAWNNRIYKW